MEATTEVGVVERLFIVHRINLIELLWLVEGVVEEIKMVYLGMIHRMAVVPMTREALTEVVVRFAEMQPIYQTLGLGLVILITGAALKVESFAGHCIAVKGEFLWVKVEKVLQIVVVGLVEEELVVSSLGEEVDIQGVD